MSEGNKDLSIISRILQYCLEVEETVVRFGDSFENFSSDKIYRNAATMCILQIGELAGRLSTEFVDSNHEIPWRNIRTMRNIVAHAYGNISIPIVWDTIKNDIPLLESYCRKTLE